MALVFLPASDIPRFVGEGNVDLGITGKDMVAEAATTLVYPANTTSSPTSPSVESTSQFQQGDMTASTSSLNGSATIRLSDLITEVLPLGFGKCALQVQVPERSTDIQKVEDLVGKRIATSFDGLATEFFENLDASVNAERSQKGQKKLPKTKIEYIGGSVEAACALGVADGIVDLVGKLIPILLCNNYPCTLLLTVLHRIWGDHASCRSTPYTYAPIIRSSLNPLVSPVWASRILDTKGNLKDSGSHCRQQVRVVQLQCRAEQSSKGNDHHSRPESGDSQSAR